MILLHIYMFIRNGTQDFMRQPSAKSIREACQFVRNPPFFTLCQVTKTSPPLSGFQSANHANSQQKDELQEGCWSPLYLVAFSCRFLVMRGEGMAADDGKENYGL